MAQSIKKGIFCPSFVRRNWLLLSTVAAVLADYQTDVERSVTMSVAASCRYLQKETYLASFYSTGLTKPKAAELTKAV